MPLPGLIRIFMQNNRSSVPGESNRPRNRNRARRGLFRKGLNLRAGAGRTFYPAVPETATCLNEPV
jgi:hypothetical protein